MKKRVLLLISFLVISFYLKSSAVAFDNMYTAETKGGAWDDSIDIGTTPWLFLQLSQSDVSYTAFWWNSPSSNQYFSFMIPSGTNPTWYSFSDFSYFNNGIKYEWSDIKTTGIWNIMANNPGGALNTSVTITPEPISSFLFLLGGGALALVQYKKRRRNSL